MCSGKMHFAVNPIKKKYPNNPINKPDLVNTV